MLRSTVESVRSRCQRLTGSLCDMCVSTALARPRLPSAFSKSIGLTLCGMVELPISPSRGLLLEVAQRDVAPGVARPVDQDGVGARHRVEQLGDPVVRLDLDRVRVERQAQALLDDAAREGLPVEIGVGREVRVVVADRAVHLGQRLHRGDARARRGQPCRDVGDLLAHRGRARGLAVRAREHRHARRTGCAMRRQRRDRGRRAPAAAPVRVRPSASARGWCC